METFAERMARAREEREESGEVVKAEHNLVRRALANPDSRKRAMDAMCFQCMGGTEDSLPDGGWKKQIGSCTAKGCAMYKWRPYQNISDAADEMQAA